MDSKTDKPSKPMRRRGRPVDNDQQSLKGDILAIAERMFAEQGYAAVSIRQIAEAAGVNPALVHYYFGSKHALLQAVAVHALKPFMDALATLRESPAAPVQEVVRLLFEMAAEHPNIPRLLTREVLLPGGEMYDYFIENMAPHLGGALPVMLAREQAAGRLREDFDPAIAALLLIALSVFPFIARTLAEPGLGISYGAGGIDKLIRHITELIESGMTK
ncbi:MAG: TetR/AcrR family transcriptional regulator [Lysobacterales bacterium]|jgi:AcrR family transcriptional regulator